MPAVRSPSQTPVSLKIACFWMCLPPSRFLNKPAKALVPQFWCGSTAVDILEAQRTTIPPVCLLRPETKHRAISSMLP